jgi:hypothetical protein
METYISNLTVRELPHPDMSPSHFSVPFFLSFNNTALEGCSDSFGGDNISMVERGFYVILALLSIVTSGLVAITIFSSPKLSMHPSKLIAYMCLCEAASCFSALVWVVKPTTIICYFGMHYLWGWTTG